jgi:hypothetical protein
VSLLPFGLAVALCWGALLLALTRGAFVVPVRDVADILRKTALLSALVGLPVAFLLGLGAGQLTCLLPFAARWRTAAWASLVSMPCYAMLIGVGVVEYSGGRWQRTPGGVVRLLSQLTILGISALAAVVTLGALMSPAGPFMGR